MNLLQELVTLNENRHMQSRTTQLDDALLSVDWSRSDTVGGAEVKAVGIRTANQSDGVSEVYLHISHGNEKLKVQVYYEPYLNVVGGFDERKSQDFEMYVEGYDDEEGQQSPEYQNLRKVVAAYMANYFEPIATHYLEEHKEKVGVENGKYD